jgi:hypothetical protein
VYANWISNAISEFIGIWHGNLIFENIAKQVNYCFCLSAFGSAQLPLTFFFQRKDMSSDTSFERPHRKEYKALKIFKAYVLKKLKSIL